MAAGRPQAGRLALLGVLLLLAGLAACSSPSPRQVEPADVEVKASDTACGVQTTSFDTGARTFWISNAGSRTTGVAVYGVGDRVVGEVDGIGPSASKRLTVSLKAGAYEIVCGPSGGRGGIRTPISVTAPSGSPPTTTPQQNRAVAAYRHYVQGQAKLLLSTLRPFTAAIRAGDITRARALYPAARQPYQRIAPIVAGMGDLASGMDARIDQVENGQVWTGFHRLEHDLFQAVDIAYDGPVVDELEADAAQVAQQVPGLDLSADQVVASARTLMQQAYAVQAVGDAELYSHLDTADIAASADGALAAYRVVRPILLTAKPALVTELDTGFGELRSALSAFGSGAVFVDRLTDAQAGQLRDAIKGVLVPLTEVKAAIDRF